MQKFCQYLTATSIAFLSTTMNAWSFSTPIDQTPRLRSIDQQVIALHKTTCVRLKFSNGSIVHAGQLWLNDNGMGRMTVKFYNANLNRSESVDQTMSLENTANGLLLVGSNPVYSGTRTRAATYSPDNFLLRVDENGRKTFFTFDLNRNVSEVEVAGC
jgi:hypothetical protein